MNRPFIELGKKNRNTFHIIFFLKIVFMLIVVFDIIEMKLDFKIECKINRYVEKEGIYIIMRE